MCTKLENYKQKFAKQVLVDWITNNGFEDLKYFGENWIGDGVFINYPLVVVKECVKNDDNNLPFAFNYNFGEPRYEFYMGDDNNDEKKCGPSMSKVMASSDRFITMLDVAIVYKGMIKTGFKLNKITDSQNKRLHEYLGKSSLKIYEISPDIILNQITKPHNITLLCKMLL